MPTIPDVASTTVQESEAETLELDKNSARQTGVGSVLGLQTFCSREEPGSWGLRESERARAAGPRGLGVVCTLLRDGKDGR